MTLAGQFQLTGLIGSSAQMRPSSFIFSALLMMTLSACGPSFQVSDQLKTFYSFGERTEENAVSLEMNGLLPQARIASAEFVGAPAILSTHLVLPNTVSLAPYHLYSPVLMGDRMWLGGWLTSADVGPDKLYLSLLRGGLWQQPEPLKWVQSDHPAGTKPGFHINDPSVVHLPNLNWHFMYFTALANEFATPSQMTKRNWVGFASSSDGGDSWFDHHIVIGQDNGIDQTGAWSPSALLVENEIWVYYHTGSSNCLDPSCQTANHLAPRVLRTRLHSNGWQKIATDDVTRETGQTLQLTNVDIQAGFGKYWLVGNTPDLLKIVLYLSDDGVRFRPFDGSEGLLINGGSLQVLTPSMKLLAVNNINLVFSLGDSNHLASSTHTWNFQLRPNPAIHSVPPQVGL